MSLTRHPHVTRKKIIAFQNKQLRRLVTHAYNDVPYYRRLFDQKGLKPKDIQTVDDLSAIPITSKRDLQPLPVEDVITRGVDPRRLIIRKTSGCTGEPFTVRRAWLEERLLGTFRLRAMHYFGLRLTDKRTMIRLLKPNDPNDNQLPLQILQAMGLYRMLQIDCRKVPEEILRSLEHFRTNVLVSYPGVLAQIAGDSICPAIHLRFIVVGGEVLTHLMRHQITKTFGAPLYNTYGSHEFNLIAWECKDTHELHTCDDSVIVEVLKNGRPAVEGERGEVVGTNLHSFAMPFIRYRLGDIVTKGSETCGCGQPFSTIRDVQGRMIDYFPLPGGRVIHPYEIVVMILRDSAPWLRQYQLVQEREDRIVLKAATWATPSSQKVAQLEENVGKLLGTDVEFQMILVPEIQLEPSGKFRVSRSLVKSHYDEIDFLSVPL